MDYCRQSGKSITKFIAELGMLSEFCKFGDMLDDMIRHCMVCGINDDNIQQRLLSEPKLTLAKATQLAQAAELAKQETGEINNGTSGSPNTQAVETSG